MKKTIYDPNYQKLTAWLKLMREEKSVTMRDLAKTMDCGWSFISKYEKNQTRLDVLQYVEICEALGIKPTDGLKVMSD